MLSTVCFHIQTAVNTQETLSPGELFNVNRLAFRRKDLLTGKLSELPVAY